MTFLTHLFGPYMLKFLLGAQAFYVFDMFCVLVVDEQNGGTKANFSRKIWGFEVRLHWQLHGCSSC